MSEPNNSSVAAPAPTVADGEAGAVAADSTEQPQRMYTAAEVAGIVRDRLKRAKGEPSSNQLATAVSAAAEQAAVAAAARVRAELDAEVAELAELAGVDPSDLLRAGRMKRLLERAGKKRSNMSMSPWKR